MHPADITVLIAYVVGMMGVGVWFARRSNNTEEFMAAGRNLPAWVVGLSIYGGFVSSISFLANPAESYEYNWNGFVFGLTVPLAAWIAVRWFVPFYRQIDSVSAYEHLEKRFGPWARTYAAGCYILMQMARMGTISYLVALATSPLLGTPIVGVIITIGVLVTIFAMIGGIEAVIWADVIQSLVLLAGAGVCVFILLTGMPEGPGQLFAIAQEHDKFSLGSFDLDFTAKTFWTVFVYGLVINLQNFGADQGYVQRYITARDERAAQRSVWVSVCMFVPTFAIFFFIGTALFAFYGAQPGLLPEGTPAKEVFPYFIVHQVPAGLSGLIVAGLFAAAQGNLATSLNSSATLLLNDVYKRYFRPAAGERESMLALHGFTVICGMVGTLAALAMIEVKDILDLWWELAGFFSGGMLGLILLGMTSSKVNSNRAAIAVVCGVLAIVWVAASRWTIWPDELQPIRSPLHRFMPIVVGTAAILLVGWLLGGKPAKTNNELNP